MRYEGEAEKRGVERLRISNKIPSSGIIKSGENEIT